MCLKPILIDNPNYHNPLASTDYGILHDCVNSKLSVPCGHCSVCIALRQAYVVQRMQMESLDNLLFMGMVSYNNESLPSMNVNGYNIRYALSDDISNMMRYIRYNNELPNFRYFAVSEFGGQKHRPHWHFIISLPKKYYQDQYGRIHLHDCYSLQEKLWSLFLKYWRRNYGSRKFPVWQPLLTYKCVGNKRNYDLSFIDTISGSCEDAAFYSSKYATKYDDYTDDLKSALYFNLPDDEFKDVWQKVKPRTLWSKFFGDPKNPKVAEYITDCINRSLTAGEVLPCFFNPVSGQSFPMSPYYQKKFLWHDAAIEFKLRQLNSERLLPDIYETKLKDIILKRTQDLIRYRSEDPSQFLYDDFDSNNSIIYNFKHEHGNIEIPALLDDFALDEW